MSMGAMRRFKHLTGIDIAAGDTASPSDMIDFMYCCTASACAADGVPFDFDAQSFADNLSPDDFARWSEGMAGDSGSQSKKKKARD